MVSFFKFSEKLIFFLFQFLFILLFLVFFECFVGLAKKNEAAKKDRQVILKLNDLFHKGIEFVRRTSRTTTRNMAVEIQNDMKNFIEMSKRRQWKSIDNIRRFNTNTSDNHRVRDRSEVIKSSKTTISSQFWPNYASSDTRISQN